MKKSKRPQPYSASSTSVAELKPSYCTQGPGTSPDHERLMFSEGARSSTQQSRLHCNLHTLTCRVICIERQQKKEGKQLATASGCSSFFRHALLNWYAPCFSVMLNMQHTNEIPWDFHLMIPLIFYVNGGFF